MHASWFSAGMVLFITGWLGVVQADVGQPPASIAVRTFSQARLLSREQALEGRPARIKAVVLCYDPAWGQLYLHDEGGETKYFSPGSFPMPLESGLQVELTGTTTFADDSATLTNLHLVVEGRAALPRARPLELHDLAGDFGQWVETSGRVRVAETSRGRLALVIENRGQSCLAFVMSGPTAPGSFKPFVGSRIRIRGINASKINNGQLQSASIFAPGLSEVTILEPAGVRPERIPVQSVESLLNRELGAWTNEMVHISGSIAAYEPGELLQVKDPTGLIRVQVVQVDRAGKGEWVEAWGFLAVSANGTSLRDGYFELARPGPGGAPAGSELEATAGGTKTNQTITQIADVLKLSKVEAGNGIPVRLRGVITFADLDWRSAFLEAADDAVYVDLKQGEARAGEWVELTGQTARGGFAPEVSSVTIQVLGKTNLPSPALVTLKDCAEGVWDAHWVEMEGVVRRAHEEWGHLTLSLVTSSGRFKAVIPTVGKQAPPDHLIDKLVRVRGACGSDLNSRGQFCGVTLHVPGLEQISIQDAGPADPFAVRSISIDRVAAFDPERVAGHRVKVSGVVTLTIRGQGFYLQDASGGLRVSAQQTNQLQAGDLAEVLGFPAPGDFGPYLEECTFRRLSVGALPVAKKATAEEILLRGTYDSMVVQLEARLLQDIPRSASPQLVLQDGPFAFTARLSGQGDGQELPLWRSGSLVRLTGVCVIQGAESHAPETFHLLVAKPADAILLQAPPRWNFRHMLILVGGLALSILTAIGWIGLLRRQVRVQTGLIRQNHQQLVEASRQAGMAEVATSILHNVGNVLNNVNTSAGLVTALTRASKAQEISHVATLLKEHRADLAQYLTANGRANQLQLYVEALGQQVAAEQATTLGELQELTKNIDHIKEIVAMQQSYAKVCGVLEFQSVPALFEDALRMHAADLLRHHVNVIRQFDPSPDILLDKYKVLQILINLISNAKYALAGSTAEDRRLTLGMHLNGDNNGGNRVRISVVDNGIGIAPEDLTRIFAQGFTTRSNGHGFGLHSGALAAREMGGALLAYSAGPSQGASFTLELPTQLKN